MVKILHFADAHIDIAAHGRHDPESGFAVRILDFLKALDTIVDAAIEEHVDLVIFAGDAYKDRTPVPTFQREWGKRIMRLSNAGIPTLLLVGNHDLSPSSGRAHALQEYETLSIPHVWVASKPCFLNPEDLGGVPVQVLALPWVSRSGLMGMLEMSASKPDEIYRALEEKLTKLVSSWLDEKINPELPLILTAHASVQGAIFGGERSVMLGNDLVLPPSLVRDPRLDYVALGHIHKPQNLDPEGHHPIIYPGSIERVDFGEVDDEKFYIIAYVEKEGKTRVEWHKLFGRKFIQRYVEVKQPDGFMDQIYAVLPSIEEIKDAELRLVVEYPFEFEGMLDETGLRKYTENCLEFHLNRRPQRESHMRLPENQSMSSMKPLDLLDLYWRSIHEDPEESVALQNLADKVIAAANGQDGDSVGMAGRDDTL